MRSRFIALSVLSLLLFPCFVEARATWYNTASVDVPVDGGVMLTYSRFYRVNRFLDIGGVVSGGQIRREFDLKASNGLEYQVETEAMVLPLAGPVVSLHYEWIGISIGYAAFQADTDVTMKNGTVGTLRGTKKAWGTGVYSPILVLDFYNQNRNLIFGVGLGAFYATSFPNLEASNGSTVISTDESPIDTLTFHLRCLWGG